MFISIDVTPDSMEDDKVREENGSVVSLGI